VSEREVFDILVYSWFGVGILVFLFLFFISAPYGRHARQGWGPTVSNTVGWVIMEAPSPLVFTACFVWGKNFTAPAWAFLFLWLLHYGYRAFIYPMRMGASGKKRMPLAIALLGVVFNSINGYINGRWLFGFADAYDTSWLWDPRFVVGTLLFLAGYVINHHSDHVLRTLRKPGETGYKVPNGGMYRFVSAPNYLGEVVEWAGWALLTFCLPGAAFAFWTAANLAPRAATHHAWYRETFPNYPKKRKALIPFLW
jgi:3-oxo-5-alpha-steroid 4-dehydrogenase 1